MTIEIKITKRGSLSLKMDGKRSNYHDVAHRLYLHTKVGTTIKNDSGKIFTCTNVDVDAPSPKCGWARGYEYTDETGKRYFFGTGEEAINRIARNSFDEWNFIADSENVSTENYLEDYAVSTDAQDVATDAEIELASHTEQAPAIVETEKFAEIIFEASALGYTGNSISKDFNNPISAYRWLKRLAKRSRNYNDGSMHITRWNTDGSRSTVYDNAGSHLEINDNSLKDFIDAQDAKEHIDSVYRSLCNGAIFYQNHFGLTQEQAEKILVAIHANNISNKEVDQMIETFKTEQTAAQDSVEVETNNSEADDERKIKIEADILTFINGRLDNIYSAKYGAMIQFLPDGGRKYFTCPLSRDGKSFDKDFDRWDIEDFFAILSERGAIATDIQPVKPEYPRREEFADDINKIADDLTDMSRLIIQAKVKLARLKKFCAECDLEIAKLEGEKELAGTDSPQAIRNLMERLKVIDLKPFLPIRRIAKTLPRRRPHSRATP